MRNTITPINPAVPITSVDGPNVRVLHQGRMTDQFRLFVLQVEQRGLLIGTGSPSGVVAAEQGQEYMDETGLAGSVKWIKQLADVGGDKTLGWVAIG